ncbi:hypothetical protein CDV36_012501 [Fusarium kuroshium]|uniref:Uncharacterized protein n=1 Tax=Fusarium kuroshium TaxID=2010991 RepID=A0A3M2RRE4_9HYPO|nr:hypothetical protein CDV36_012501 [Fusarium kuroshium]
MCLGLLTIEYDAEAFLSIDRAATLDIHEAERFYKRYMKHREDQLLRDYKKAMDKTGKALQEFRGVFGFVDPPYGKGKERAQALELFKPQGIRMKLKWVLGGRRAADGLALALKYEQSNLCRQAGWLMTTLDRVPFYDEEEGELPSSMPPKSASTKLASSVPPDQLD